MEKIYTMIMKMISRTKKKQKIIMMIMENNIMIFTIFISSLTGMTLMEQN